MQKSSVKTLWDVVCSANSNSKWFLKGEVVICIFKWDSGEELTGLNFFLP